MSLAPLTLSLFPQAWRGVLFEAKSLFAQGIAFLALKLPVTFLISAGLPPSR